MVPARPDIHIASPGRHETTAIRFDDLLGDAFYERDGNEILARGSYVEMPAYVYHVFPHARPRTSGARRAELIHLYTHP